MMQKDEILTAALSLPEAVRADIAEKLFESLDGTNPHEIDSLWAAEAESRIRAFERGEIEAVPGEKVFAELRARHRQ